MPEFLTDDEIQALIAVPKRVPAEFARRIAPRPKRGHSEADVDLQGDDGSEFRVVARRSNANALDFSLILVYKVPGSNATLRLRRYNGKSHEHSNHLESERFYDYHVHTATERYQRSGNREDTFAEVTDRYTTLEEAVACLIEDRSIVLPDDPQGQLFAT